MELRAQQRKNEIRKESTDSFEKVPINSMNDFMVISNILNGGKQVFIIDGP